MNQRTATVLALCAVVIGSIIALIHGVVAVINLARFNVPVFQLIIQLLSANDWVGNGLILLFAMILFFPRAQRLGAIGVIIGALLRLFFALNALVSILAHWGMVGSVRYIFFLSPVFALTILAFGIFWAVNPHSQAVRISALVVGLGMAVNLVLRVLLNPLGLVGALSLLLSAIVIIWFIQLFLQGNTLRDS